jgi:hypothetical protein
MVLEAALVACAPLTKHLVPRSVGRPMFYLKDYYFYTAGVGRLI